MGSFVDALAQAGRAPLHVVEQRLSECSHGFHEFDRIFPGSLNTWSGLNWLRGSALAGDFSHGKKGYQAYVACYQTLHLRTPCGKSSCQQSDHSAIVTTTLGEMTLISQLITRFTTQRHDINQNMGSIPNSASRNKEATESEANRPSCHEAGTKTGYVQSNVREQRVPRG